jgi:hypothetical protein
LVKTQTKKGRKRKMTTQDKNKLAFHYANAMQDYKDAQEKEELEFYPVELTLERVESAGYLQGLEFGAIAGYRHAIALLQAEQFTEHAHVLESQLKTITAIFETVSE